MAGNYFIRSDPNNIPNSNIIPDYIRVKENILDMWFRIQREYHVYIDRRSNNIEYGSGRIFSLIKSLYFTNLYPLIKKSMKKIEKDKKENENHIETKIEKFVKLMNMSKIKMLELNESQMASLIEFLSSYLYEIGLTKVDLDVKPFDQAFEDTY